MSDQEYNAGLKPHIAALRERATQTRQLASQVDDTLAREGLIQRAEEFERRAEDLEARLAILHRETGQQDRPANDIAATKPPDGMPDGEA